MARRRAASRRGFTLIEAALATIIIGVGVVALVEAHQSFMRTNQWSSHAAAATYLGNELREFMRDLPRHDPASGLWIDSGSGSPVLTGWGPEDGEVTIADFDDLDDFDGVSFAFDGSPGLGDGDLPGPVDAFGNVIPEIFADGSIMLDPVGDEVPMIGWVQTVIVEKVDPADLSTGVPDATVKAPSGLDPGLAVDEFPVRVQVVVSYAGPFQAYAEEITRVSWIVP